MVEDDSFDKEGILDNIEEFSLLINLGVYGLIKSAKPSHDFSPSFKEVSLKNPLRVLSIRRRGGSILMILLYCSIVE